MGRGNGRAPPAEPVYEPVTLTTTQGITKSFYPVGSISKPQGTPQPGFVEPLFPNWNDIRSKRDKGPYELNPSISAKSQLNEYAAHHALTQPYYNSRMGNEANGEWVCAVTFE